MDLPILKIEKLCYSYAGGKEILAGVDLCVSKGESVALIGANGAGKSTLLQLISGVLAPSSGEILFDGEPVTKRSLTRAREKLGFVFQNPEHQLFCASVYEDVAFGPLNYGLSRDEADARAMEALSRLGITGLKDRPPYKLSAGEKRLAAIACVLSSRPKLLLMDEPTAELDPRARRELIPLINSLPQGKIIATHDLDFAMRTCGSAVILYGGKVAAEGRSAELLKDGHLLESHGL